MTTPLTKLLDEVEQRLGKATPGPWGEIASLSQKCCIIRHNQINRGSDYVAQIVWSGQQAHDWHVSNAELIAHAPDDLKTLLALVKRQRVALEHGQVIREGSSIFKLAVSRVENCICQNEKCEMCVLARAVIGVVELDKTRTCIRDCDRIAKGEV